MLLRNTDEQLMKTPLVCWHKSCTGIDKAKLKYILLFICERAVTIYSELWIAFCMLSSGISSYSVSRFFILMVSPYPTHIRRVKEEIHFFFQVQRASSTPCNGHYDSHFSVSHTAHHRKEHTDQKAHAFCSNKSRQIPKFHKKAQPQWIGAACNLGTKITFGKEGDRTVAGSCGAGSEPDQSWWISQSHVHLENAMHLHSPQESLLLKLTVRPKWWLWHWESTVCNPCVGKPVTLPNEIFCMLLWHCWSIRRLTYTNFQDMLKDYLSLGDSAEVTVHRPAFMRHKMCIDLW